MGKIAGTTGFTIIETMLFLAITGVMAVGILVGSGVTIAQQRYRDSVNSLQTLLQDQYSQVRDVVNGRDTNWSCDSQGTILPVATGSGQVRGTANCVMLGRLLQVDNTGKKITTASVVGVRKPGVTTASSDIQELKTNYYLKVSPVEQETKEVGWGGVIVKPNTTTPQPLSMLVVRSPISGATITFTKVGQVQTTAISTLVDVANTTQTVPLCVDADTSAFMRQRLAVQISPLAASQSAIQIPAESDNVCGA